MVVQFDYRGGMKSILVQFHSQLVALRMLYCKVPLALYSEFHNPDEAASQIMSQCWKGNQGEKSTLN